MTIRICENCQAMSEVNEVIIVVISRIMLGDKYKLAK